MTDLGIPNGWSKARVDRVANVNARIGWKALTASEYVDEGYAFLSTPNIKNASIDFENVNYISEYRYQESPELALRPDDVLLVKDGNTLGITNIVAALPRAATVNGSIAVLRPIDVEPRFLRYSLDGSLIQGLIRAVKAGMGVPHLFQFDINRLPLLLPPRPEQRAIADFLDTETARIDGLVAKKQQLRAALEEKWAATVARRLGGARRWDADELPDLPPGWEWMQARHVFPRVTVGVVVNPSSYFRDQGVPFIHGTDIRRGWIDTSDLKFLDDVDSRGALAKSRLSSGDVVAMRVGEPGRAAEVPLQLDGANCASVLIFKRSQRLDSYLAASFLNSQPGRAQVEAVQYGAAQGVLNVGDAVALRFPVPPPAEQPQLVEELRGLATRTMTVQSALTRQLRLLDEHRQALITAAVTGELEVPGVAA